MTDYRLVTNRVPPTQVRETDGAYVIEDVPFIRPMELAGGYVPEDSIQATIDAWAGTPATLNHPRNERGEPVAANRKPETHLGVNERPRYDGETGRVDIRIRKQRLDEVGGEATAVREALEQGEPIDVSSQYASQDLPAGEYDGAYRANVERIVRPDSIAILPNQRGRCSVQDGCGINPAMVANAAVTVPMRQRTNDRTTVAGVSFRGTRDGDLDEAAIDKEAVDLGDHYLYGDGEDKTDHSYPVVDGEGYLRRGNVEAAHQLGCRGRCDDSARHDARLRELARQFDPAPAWARDESKQSDNTDRPPMTRTHDGEAIRSNAQFAEGDLVQWSWSGGTARGRVAEVHEDDGTITRTIEGTDVSKDSDEQPVYLVDVWRGGGYEGEALRQEGARDLSEWQDPPEDAMTANMEVPAAYRFDNPGEAVAAAQEMGFDGAGDEIIHTHGSGEDTEFMPAPSHDELLEKLEEMGEMDAAGAHGDGDGDEEMSGNAVRWALDTLRAALSANGTAPAADDGTTPEDSGTAGDTDTGADTDTGTDVDRDALVDDITSNSPLTEAALEARCDEGLEAIHADVMASATANAGGEDGTDTADDTNADSDANTDTDTDMSDNDDAIGLDDLTDEAVDELADRLREQMEANREQDEQTELAQEIVANSAEYDDVDAVREDYPTTPALEAKRDALDDGPAVAPAGGLGANADLGGDDLPDDIDVSAGVFR